MSSIRETKVLFIDDVRDPYGRLGEELGISDSREIQWVKSSKAALRLLTDGWDEIWFDHDLAFQNGVEDTTMIVAQTLAELVYDKEIDPKEFATCIIHTSNPVGRTNLQAVLGRWGFDVQHVFI